MIIIGRNKFGSYLKRMRKKRNVTQADLAKELGYGSSQFVSNWERGLCNPPYHAIPSISKFLQIPERKMVSTILELTKLTIENHFQSQTIFKSKSS